MKIETYDVPGMSAANFSRPGGIMEIHYDIKNVRVIQRMPNPASPNLPWITINDTSMTIDNFNRFILPSLGIMAKLIKTSNG